MRLWPAHWWPREAWWKDPDDPTQVVGWGPFPLPGERAASRQLGDTTRAYAAEIRARRNQETLTTSIPLHQADMLSRHCQSHLVLREPLCSTCREGIIAKAQAQGMTPHVYSKATILTRDGAKLATITWAPGWHIQHLYPTTGTQP